MPDTATTLTAAATPRIEYRRLAGGEKLPPDVLCSVTFGGEGPPFVDRRLVRVGLEPLRGGGITEIWHASSPVRVGFDGPIRYAADAEHLAGAIELDERSYGGIAGAAQTAYAAIRRFHTGSSHPHVLRVWNYFDDINGGSGDAERYKQFCIGRAAALGRDGIRTSPAATAIGRRDGDPTLQVYWLARCRRGLPVENPRQLSAYRYPRRYGPAAPAFSRAMLVSGGLLMISGTASIVGHASHHSGDLAAQCDETLANLDTVLQRAVATAPQIAPRFGRGSLLKIYLRHRESAAEVEALLQKRLQPGVQWMILEADICRRELLVEIDCIHRAEG